MANLRTRIERETSAAVDRNAEGMAQLLQTELLAHGINLAEGSPRRGARRDPRVEMWFDGKDTTSLERLILILRRARGST